MKPSPLKVIVLAYVTFASPSVGRTVKNVGNGEQQPSSTSPTKIEAKMFGDCGPLARDSDDRSQPIDSRETSAGVGTPNSTCKPSQCDVYKKNYDVEKILSKYGGPPGKVNAEWENVEDAPKTDERRRIVWYPNRKYWLYDYRDSDYKSYVRLEYAFRRSSKTPSAYIGVRGELYWTPPELCGAWRYASYFVDDTGFEANVSRDCQLVKDTLMCSELPDCEGCLSGGANYQLLLQSLLG